MAAEPAGTLTGQSLSHFRVLSLLGAGVMGEVYLAEDTLLARQVALKLLPAHFTSDEARSACPKGPAHHQVKCQRKSRTSKSHTW
jgi:serine/threonine protein kinase